MFHSMLIFYILLISYTTTVSCSRNNKPSYEHCPYYNNHRHHHEHSAIPYSSSGSNPSVLNNIRTEDEDESVERVQPHRRPDAAKSSEEDEEYDEPSGLEVRNMGDTGVRDKTYGYNSTKSYGNYSNTDKETEVSEYFLKAYFPELNDFYPGTAIAPQEYHITIQPNIKEIRNKLAKKIDQTTSDFTHAIKTIRTMLNEETIEAVSSLITLPSTEFQFIKNVIKILKVTMENVVQCVSTAGNRLMSLPRRWSASYQPCVVDEFKESWGIVENVHHIFQNAVYYIKNFISKLETCFTHEESLIQWCINDIFNDVPSYVQETVTKLNRELDSGVTYLKAVPVRVDKCQMSDDAEKKLLLPFMIIREMVKCVLSKAEL